MADTLECFAELPTGRTNISSARWYEIVLRCSAPRTRSYTIREDEAEGWAGVEESVCRVTKPLDRTGRIDKKTGLRLWKLRFK